MGAVSAHDPAARTVELTTHDGEIEELHYDQLLSRSARSAARCRCPGLDQHAIGFKSLADAIWLRNHLVETLEAANATEDPARREALLTYVFVGGGYAGPRGAGRAPGLRRRRDPALPARPAARDAVDPGRGDAAGPARDRPEACRLRAPASSAGAASTSASARPSRSVEADRVELSTGERIPTRTVVWTAGVTPHPSLRSMRCQLDERGRVPVDDHLAVPGLEGVYRRRRLRGGPQSRRRHLPADRPARDPPGAVAARNMAASLGVGRARDVHLPQPRIVREPRPPQGRRDEQSPGGMTLSGFPAWWAARTYHVSQIPGARPQAPRGRRLDGRPAVRAATPPRSARSATPRR